MRLGTHQECIGSLPKVLEVCQDGTREFTRRRSRLVGRLSGVVEKLTGIRYEIRRRDQEAHSEHTGRSPEEDWMTCRKNNGGYQIGESWVLV
ncbi:hypothetical protein GW17_00057867 [Ensete ventricosum]|nr:hypothetical protein GW17_00057867 [Ensete ventricosum]